MSLETQTLQRKIELNDLYQEVILDHSRHPRYKQALAPCQFCQEGKNPLCGDNIKVFCNVDAHQCLQVAFEGSGCSISQASASMMCEALHGVPLHQARSVLKVAEEIYTGKVKINSDDLEHDLEALSGVSKFPVRVKCAALPWKTFEILLKDHFEPHNKIPTMLTRVSTIQPKQNEKRLKVVSTE